MKCRNVWLGDLKPGDVYHSTQFGDCDDQSYWWVVLAQGTKRDTKTHVIIAMRYGKDYVSTGMFNTISTAHLIEL